MRVGVLRLGLGHRRRFLAASAGSEGYFLGTDANASEEVVGLFAESVFGNRLCDRRGELVLEIAEDEAVLGTFRSGDTRDDRAEIEINDLCVIDLTLLRNTPEA